MNNPIIANPVNPNKKGQSIFKVDTSPKKNPSSALPAIIAREVPIAAFISICIKSPKRAFESRGDWTRTSDLTPPRRVR